MKKLLATTALSLSLMYAGAAFAADSSKTATAEKDKPHRSHEWKGDSKMLSALPKDKAELFSASMKQVGEQNKESYEQMKVLYGELGAITKADSFDDKAYIAKSNEINQLQDKIHASRTEAMAGFLAKLNKDERVKFADSIKNMRHDKHKGGRHDGEKGEKGARKPAIDAKKK